MRHVIQGRTLGKALQEEGLLPPNCQLVEVLIPADGAATIRYTVLVDAADLPKLARAMVKTGEAA